MHNSLSEVSPEVPLRSDIIIVGAGLAGLFLADALVKQNKKVIVLESGYESQKTETHILNEVESTNDRYRGADCGRFRCVGGTSTRWGGALLPYQPFDLGAHPLGWHDGWGIDPGAMECALSAAEGVFGVIPGSYEELSAASVNELLPGFVPRSPKWPSFRNRSSANLFGRLIQSDPKLELWTDATVTEVELNSNRVKGVVARSLSGRALKARAPVVVIAAGAIETTRLLLLMDRFNNGRIFKQSSPLGKGFHDHLSAPIADLSGYDAKQLSKKFAFRFVKGGMRNLRFELSPDTRTRGGLPAAFTHVAFSRNPDSGFEGLRGLLQAIQRREMPDFEHLRMILKDAPWFANAIWSRVASGRVLPPSNSKFEIHLVTEQEPVASNRITLSEHSTDMFGSPLPRISWRVSERDIEHFCHLASFTVDSWRAGRLGQLSNINPKSRVELEASLKAGGGIYHPAGTTRIGSSASKGVVDEKLQVHGIDGLRVLSTSVFPSIGGASPSLALVQLAICMARDIAGSGR